MKTKSELRTIAKEIRNKLDMTDISEKILINFFASSYYKTAENIFAYFPTGTELDIKPLFDNKNKNFYLPQIADIGNKMFFAKYQKGNTSLKQNKFGIFEPNGKAIVPEARDLIILPALMVDKKGYRIGYGGGYYDRYLNDNAIKATKIILIPDALITSELPKEEFDIPADVILTETQIFKIQQI